MFPRRFAVGMLLLVSVATANGQATNSSDSPEGAALRLRKEAESGTISSQFALADLLLHDESPSAQQEGLKWMQKAADAGNTEAQTDLGAMYLWGNIASKDEQKAFLYFSKAAAQSWSPAYNEVGLCLLKGTGVGEDREAAIRWFRKGAAEGEPPAEYNLGSTLFSEAANQEQRQEGWDWMEKSAEHGYEFAQEIVGTRYLGLDGIQRNPEKALKYLLPLAESGNHKYQSLVGSIYLDKNSSLYDVTQGARWVLASVQTDDDEEEPEPGVLYKAALLLATGTGAARDGPQALALASKAAQAGDADAYTLIGEMYSSGLGIPQSYPLAVQNFRLATEHGSVSGESDLGQMYFFGKGVNRNPEAAFKYISHAAERGFAVAQRDLGMYYLEFPAGNPNYKEAAKWILLAERNGDEGAEGPLGMIYANGYGVEKDQVKAVHYYESAIEKKQPGTALSLNGLAWILCTSRDGSLLNARRALELARRAAELSRGQIPSIIDTLSAAQAANGDFVSAVQTERHALEMQPTNPNFKRHLEVLLQHQRIIE